MSSIYKIRFFTGIFLLLAAVTLWVWVLWPVSNLGKTIEFPAITSSDPRFTSILDQINARSLQAQLVYPTRLHTGETGDFSVQISSLKKSLNSGNPSSDGQVMVEGRIDLPLVQLDPPAGIQETFSLDNLPQFSWRIKSNEQQIFKGQFWFYILFVSPDGTTDREAILSIPVEIEIQSLLGMTESVLIWIAVILSMAGILVFPIFSFHRE